MPPCLPALNLRPVVANVPTKSFTPADGSVNITLVTSLKLFEPIETSKRYKPT